MVHCKTCFSRLSHILAVLNVLCKPMINVSESRGQGDFNSYAIVHKNCDCLYKPFMFVYLRTYVASHKYVAINPESCTHF